MSVHLLEVVPRDVAAGALGLLLGAPAPPALAALELRSGAGRLVLGVLGSSHVVQAAAPDRSGAARTCVEQVSCDATAAGGLPLPARHQDGAYALETRTQVRPMEDLQALARRLRATAAGDDAWLCGAFPTSGSAVTALTGQPVPGGWAWQTWHLYPGDDTGTVVTTSTRWTP